MNHPIIRPRVADLEFRVYDRPLHPELFETLALRRVRRDGYSLAVRMIPTGHVLEWAKGDAYLAEMTTTTDQPLPAHGRRLAHPFRGEKRGRYEVAPGVRYQMNLQVEVLAPEVFLHVHEELIADGAKRGLLFHFRPHYRLGLSPIGYVTVEPVPSGLCVAAFHTFPDEFAVVKTQSLIEAVPVQ
ncbi:DUF2617 family protein [Fimbriiglobus ruber]|uniref:DUF2617 domain-containing protein n=1 Tax=Fimbriiglobus ruber TaxID=1908690 RepID=A0A225DR88_9BACT|nr:DUF2617 family protein [Fimbriiglobus ruber]OWK43912.1 hypothetical protein FRUB_03511 [Fimbriiglobus ruber]